MTGEQIVLILVVLWALIHSYVDYQMSKRVEKLEKQLAEHKHS